MNTENILNFPETYSQSDKLLVNEIIASAQENSMVYDGDFKARWLLSQFDEPVWETRNKGREKVVNGKWINTVKIKWDIILPNGKLLTAPCYKNILDSIKKSLFIIRSGITGKSYGVLRWRNEVHCVLQLTRWVFLNERKYNPEKHGFKLIDQSSLDSLFYKLSIGGWFSALEIPQRILSAIQKDYSVSSTHSVLFEGDIDNLCKRDIQCVINWFELNDYYLITSAGVYSGSKYLNREKIAKLINIDSTSFATQLKPSAFLRQFETDFLKSPLLVPIMSYNEYPSQKTPLIDEARNIHSSRKSLSSEADSLKLFFSTHRHLNDVIPDPYIASPKLSFNKFKAQTVEPKHTPFIPVNTGLTYLNNAVKWVNNYGDATVDGFIEYAKQIEHVEYKSVNKHKRKKLLNKWWKNLKLQNITVNDEQYNNIAEFIDTTDYVRNKMKCDINKTREKPTLDEAMSILIGACVICIGLLKPSRNDELVHLPYDCLLEKNDGYYLLFLLGKSNSGECIQQVEKPIPYITAKSIKLLQKISSTVSLYYDNQYINTDKLFNLPSNMPCKAKSISSGFLSSYLDLFCDYVNVPADEFGRRWYIRIHEMRKWFLLLLFWSGRYDVLDAARWIAGHTDAAHLYAYIEKEFPGEELPKIEAEYAIERLRKHEYSTRENVTEEGIDSLYETVLNHFQASSLTMIPDTEWEEYVAILRQEEGFILEPHSIYGKNDKELVGIDVCFVLREESNG